MIGYKGFESDLTCRGLQYVVGQMVTMQKPIKLCVSGFHFCRYPLDVLSYYADHVYAIVEASGDILEDYDKCVTNQLTVVRLITRDQLFAAMPTHIVRKDGTVEWYHKGQRHRENGPAIENPNGSKEWYLNGKLHRTDGPAIEESRYTVWYYDGKIHRIGGPAIEWNNSYKAWYHHGQRHRTDGPAVEESDGTKKWYRYGMPCKGGAD